MLRATTILKNPRSGGGRIFFFFLNRVNGGTHNPPPECGTLANKDAESESDVRVHSGAATSSLDVEASGPSMFENGSDDAHFDVL